MYKGLLIHNLLCSEFVELTLILIHNQADFGSAQCGTKVCFLFIGSRLALEDIFAQW